MSVINDTIARKVAALRLNPRTDLLRSEEALDILAKSYIDDLSAADLVSWCVRQEYEWIVRCTGINVNDACATVLLRLALDAPSVILAALAAEDPDETNADLHIRLEFLSDMLEAKRFGKPS